MGSSFPDHFISNKGFHFVQGMAMPESPIDTHFFWGIDREDSFSDSVDVRAFLVGWRKNLNKLKQYLSKRFLKNSIRELLMHYNEASSTHE